MRSRRICRWTRRRRTRPSTRAALAPSSILRAQLREARPDVLLIFGDDQLEQFDFGNLPAFCVFIGDEHLRLPDLAVLRAAGRARAAVAAEDSRALGDAQRPSAARAQARRRARRAALRHGVQRECRDGERHRARVHAPGRVPRARRGDSGRSVLHQLLLRPPADGAAGATSSGVPFGEIVDAWPSDMRVGVIGSGGLWHTPMGRNAYIDQAFDREILAALARGDARAMAADIRCAPARGRSGRRGAGGARQRRHGDGAGATAAAPARSATGSPRAPSSTERRGRSSTTWTSTPRRWAPVSRTGTSGAESTCTRATSSSTRTATSPRRRSFGRMPTT